jgi:phosphopantetheinyl transferase (holo-ACP synthase)
MVKDNLKVQEDSAKRFEDTKYGFYFSHDIQNDFESEYELVRDKYIRRAERFMESIKKPTVFFRCIRDNDEVEYINNNWEYAEKLLKRFNAKNRIIYVFCSELNKVTDRVESYQLGIGKYHGRTQYELRHTFDTSQELLGICTGLISIEKMKNNIEFDNITYANRVTSEYMNKCFAENLDGLDGVILDYLEASRDEEIYIWGAGKYGRALVKYLVERNVKIKGIIDNKILTEEDEKLNVIPFEKVDDGAKIFIAVADDKANEDIANQILGRHTRTVFVRFQDLHEEDLYKNIIFEKS